MGHWAQHPFQKQVVDVDADIVVIEGYFRGRPESGIARSVCISQTCVGASGQAVEKSGPAFLQEVPERFSVRNDRLQRPSFEGTVLSQYMHQPFVEETRHELPPVVSSQQDT